MAYAIRHHAPVWTASGLDLLAGVWLLVSPFALTFPTKGGVTGINLFVGILVTLLALLRLSGPPLKTGWASWCNVLLGAGTLVSPWLMGFSGARTPTINNLVTGVCIMVFSFWSAAAGSIEQQDEIDEEQARVNG